MSLRALSEKAGTATAETGDVVEAPMASIDADAIALLKVRVGAGVSALSDSVMKGRAIDVSGRPGGIRDFIIAAATTTATVSTTLMTFTTNIPVTQGFRLTGSFRKTATNPNEVAFGLTINATVIFTAGATGFLASSAVNRAEDGMFEITIGPRSNANYLGGFNSWYIWRVTSSGAIAVNPAFPTTVAAAALPNAAITSIVLTGINVTANNNVELANVYLWND